MASSVPAWGRRRISCRTPNSERRHHANHSGLANERTPSSLLLALFRSAPITCCTLLWQQHGRWCGGRFVATTIKKVSPVVSGVQLRYICNVNPIEFIEVLNFSRISNYVSAFINSLLSNETTNQKHRRQTIVTQRD